MNKFTLLTASVFALGGVGLLSSIQSVHADMSSENSPPQIQEVSPSPTASIFDEGKFIQPLTLDKYDYDLNMVGLSTGKVTMEYDSHSLATIGIGISRHFFLKLPAEFQRISGMNNGDDLKAAITASYKLPGDSTYTKVMLDDIDASFEGQIDFTLAATKLINIGSTTSIKIQIDYGKILDSLNLGPSFDYKKIIPDASARGYNFTATVTTNEWFDIWPNTAASAFTDGYEAVH